jgi:hypothetical protein
MFLRRGSDLVSMTVDLCYNLELTLDSDQQREPGNSWAFCRLLAPWARILLVFNQGSFRVAALVSLKTRFL